MSRYLFKDIVVGEEGLLKGPFGSDLKKSLYVPKGDNTYKVYLQENILKEDNTVGEHYISKEYFNSKMSRYEVKENDFIVTCDGTLGEIFQLKQIKERGIISSSLLRITLNNEIVDCNYFYYLFKAIIKKALITQGNNSVLKHLPGINVIKNYVVELPELKVQKRIGYLLHTVDVKIKNNNKIISELESMAKAIYDYWFLQYEFPNEEGKTYKSSGGKMVYNEELKKEIPEGWIVKQLSELATFNNGINYDKDETGDKNYKIINVRNITSSSLLIDEAELDSIELKKVQGDKYLVEPNDILIARSGTPGAVRLLLPNHNDIIYCGFIIKCKPINVEQRLLITYYLKMLEGSNATKTGGSIMQNVSQDTLKQVKVCLPSKSTINLFNIRISTILSNIQCLIQENQELTQLRDYLLPLLMNGQVGFKE